MTSPALPLVERVVAILAAENFRPAQHPLVVASVPFEFAAALVGVGRAPDLIVVIDTVAEPVELRIRQKIDSLARALDVAGSRRPVTAVLVGPKPSDPTIEALSRVCRVLPVGTPTGDKADELLRDWLAVLLPLPLPAPGKAISEAKTELAAKLPAELDERLRKSLLSAAEQGPEAVKHALKKSIEAPLAVVETLEGGAA